MPGAIVCVSLLTQPPAGARPDPNNPGWYLGWGVRRLDPWHLAGFYGSQAEAEATQREVGDTHEAAFGSHRLGSDDFMEGDSEVRASVSNPYRSPRS